MSLPEIEKLLTCVSCDRHIGVCHVVTERKKLVQRGDYLFLML